MANGPSLSKAGSTPIKKLGHTVGNKHGSDPLVKARGDKPPTEITYRQIGPGSLMASNDTYAGALEVLMKQIAGMKGLADANLPFLVQIETQVIGEIRSPERQMQAAGILPAGPANPQGVGAPGMPNLPGGPMGGMGGGMPAPPASFAGDGGPPGIPAGPAPANADELRRVLTTPGQENHVPID